LGSLLFADFPFPNLTVDNAAFTFPIDDAAVKKVGVLLSRTAALWLRATGASPAHPTPAASTLTLAVTPAAPHRL
jgi:hypothetical protein